MSVSIDTKLESLSNEELAFVKWKIEWQLQAREKQRVPSGSWNSHGVLAGRGFGKTVLAAHWVIEEAMQDAGSFSAIVAPTLSDVRYTCLEGPTGVISVCPPALIADYNRSDLIVYLKNGSIIRGFGTDRADRLRGPQHHRVWGDEVAAWTNARDVFDMMKFGLRLGSNPKFLWTTTPKPVPLVRDLMKQIDGKKHTIIQGTTYENRANLASSFFEDLVRYEGTAIGRQELYGELLDPEDSGYVKRKQWRLWPSRDALPHFHFVIMSLDTAFTEKTFDEKKQDGDPTACSVWGVFEHDGQVNVMLLDAWEDRLGFPDLLERVKRERKNAYGQGDGEGDSVLYAHLGTPLIGRVKELTGRTVDAILIEDKGSGISLRQALAREDILTHPYNPGRMDKLARLHVVSPLFANRRVWAVESNKREGTFRSWAEPLVSQVCSYIGPGSLDHDDLLDTATQALKYLSDRFFGPFTLPPKSKESKMADEMAERESRAPRTNAYAN